MSFYPGQHVVCVDDRTPWYGDYADTVIQRGNVYTVRRVGFDSRINQRNHGQVDLWLVEVRRVFDIGFGARRFRPLDESRLDIFRQHLAPVPEREPA